MKRTNILITGYTLLIVGLLGVQQWQIYQLKNAQFAVPTSETIRFTAKDEACLAKNIFYEAGVEGIEGKYAVAQVTINRLQDGRWGNSICKVVYSKNQFSWTGLKKKAKLTGGNWVESQYIAYRVLHEGYRARQLVDVLWYHNQQVRPFWTSALAKLDQIGQHTFYTERT